MVDQVAKQDPKQQKIKQKQADKFNVDYGGVFARILASENLYVEVQPKAPTAYFNTKDRVLTLPDWNVTDETFQFLMAHEVAHAIWTPSEGWLNAIERHKKEEQFLYQMVLNVVEDCRIDKLMQEKYPGIRRQYLRGITEIATELDFFGMKPDPKTGEVKAISERSLVDRINTFYKTKPIGNFYKVPFAPGEEQEIVDEIEEVRSFDKVVEIADRLYEQFKKENKDLIESMKKFTFTIRKVDGSSQKATSGGSAGDGENVTYEVVIDQDSMSKAEKEAIEKAIATAIQNDELDKHTTSKQTSHSYSKSYFYLEDPKNIDQHIIPVKSLRLPKSPAQLPSRDYINYMASVFERKMKARDFAKTAESKTGALDMHQLSSYKFKDDLFLRQEITVDNKNHGAILVIDGSGSMSNIFKDVIEHCFKFVLFLDRIRVPFKVFVFTDIMGKQAKDASSFGGGQFGLIEVFSSKFSLLENKENYQKMMGFNQLGGTPLSTAINFVKKIGEDFKAEKRIDILNYMFLTDGGCTCHNVHDYIVDKKSKIVKKTGTNIEGTHDNTPALYQILRQRLGCNVYHYYINEGGKKVEVKDNFAGTTSTFVVNKSLFRDKNMASKTLINKIVENMAILKK